MPNGGEHSPGPWQWTDFGVLSDANGEAILDYENWCLSPEDAVLIASAPKLLDWVRKALSAHGSRLPNDIAREGAALVTQATDPTLGK